LKDFSQYKLDVVPSPIDQRDYKAETIFPKRVRVPASLDLRPDLQPIRDQGSQGSCVAQVGACMKEWQELQDIGFDQYMSPQFIYNNRSTAGEGMFPRDLMSILRNIGSVPESMFPYGHLGDPPEDLYEEAKEYKIQHYAQIDTIEGLKTALNKNGPCYGTFPVYGYGNQLWRPTNLGILGYHAMTFVGYNSKGFIIRNSWGDDWADKGYTIFPYEDWGLQVEVWTTIDAESGQEDFEDNWREFWFYKWRWVKEHWHTLIYFVLIAIFLGYILIDKVF
jgi:C1A family cysteine protease